MTDYYGIIQHIKRKIGVYMDRIQQRAYRGNMTSTVHENSCILNMQHR